MIKETNGKMCHLDSCASGDDDDDDHHPHWHVSSWQLCNASGAASDRRSLPETMRVIIVMIRNHCDCHHRHYRHHHHHRHDHHDHHDRLDQCYNNNGDSHDHCDRHDNIVIIMIIVTIMMLITVIWSDDDTSVPSLYFFSLPDLGHTKQIWDNAVWCIMIILAHYYFAAVLQFWTSLIILWRISPSSRFYHERGSIIEAGESRPLVVITSGSQVATKLQLHSNSHYYCF